MYKWLLLTYKVPPDPSAKRVYIWRKLKRFGALLYQDSCWILPSSPRTHEQLQWLAAEIIEQVNQLYLEITKKLEREDADLDSLAREYQQTSSKDHFNSEAGRRLRETLLSRRGRKS